MRVEYTSDNQMSIIDPDTQERITILKQANGELTIAFANKEYYRAVKEVQNRTDGYNSVSLIKVNK